MIVQVYAQILRSFVALFIWLNAFYYLRGFRTTGPYVRIVLEIVVDLRGCAAAGPLLA